LGFFTFGFKTYQINNRRARAYPYLMILSKDGGCFLDGFLLLLYITVLADPCALQTSRFYGSTLPNYSPLSHRFMQGVLGEKCVQGEGGQSFLFHLLFWPKVRGKVMSSLFFNVFILPYIYLRSCLAICSNLFLTLLFFLLCALVLHFTICLTSLPYPSFHTF
jgi:hypothetical protein